MYPFISKLASNLAKNYWKLKIFQIQSEAGYNSDSGSEYKLIVRIQSSMNPIKSAFGL